MILGRKSAELAVVETDCIQFQAIATDDLAAAVGNLQRLPEQQGVSTDHGAIRVGQGAA
ncbi:hypothetical protein D3C79_1027320 [compost metagenome]